jgi:pyridoxamine 5'-phosphate oxidase
MNEVSDRIRQLRKDYAMGALDEAQAHPDPTEQFRQWLDEALSANLTEPYAMALGTVNDEGQPSVRIVLLRGFDASGFMFFTNYESRKGQDLLHHPKAALTFFWQELERQVRIEGTVTRANAAESDAYFLSRPRESRIGAWASPQSQVLPDRHALDALLGQRVAEFEGTEVQRPDHWGGYRLAPHTIEFWQGRPSRLHDRIRYRLVDGIWLRERLAP